MKSTVSGSKKATYRGASKEFRDLAKRLTCAGAEIRFPRGHGHPRVYYQGQFVTSISMTPSDWRARKNEIARCRRAGIQIDQGRS